jgi:hypothetical protein
MLNNIRSIGLEINLDKERRHRGIKRKKGMSPDEG